MARTMLGVGPLGWSETIPPRELRRIKALAEEYDALAVEIDRRYEAGKVKGIEDLEERAEQLLEELSGLYDYYYSEGDPNEGEGFSIEERIISVWNKMDSFDSREDWISNMRESIRQAVYEGSKVFVNPTDEQVLAIAEDVVRRREALFRRYKQPKKKGKPYMGVVEKKGWQHWLPEHTVPKALQDLVDAGVLRDETTRNDYQLRLETIFTDGSELVLWIEHPIRRVRFWKRYRLDLHEPGSLPVTRLETDDLREVLVAIRQLFEEKGGPRPLA